MLYKGIYKINCKINISHSLLSQVENEVKNNKEDLYKVLLEKDKKKFIAFFTQGNTLGNNSIIEINKNLKNFLITEKDYKIIKEIKYEYDKGLIERLLSKKN